MPLNSLVCRNAPVTNDTDPYFSNVVLLMHMDGTDGGSVFTDQKSKVVSKVGSPLTVAANAKFGTASAQFNGSSALTIPGQVDFDFGAGDMTIEFWFNTTQSLTYATPITREWGASPYTGGWSFQLSPSNVSVYWADFSTASPLFSHNTTTHRDGNWHHYAWVRVGNVHSLYLDGALIANATTTANFASGATKNITIANDASFSGRFYNGLIDDLRITKGVARYNGPFTPPTTQFPDK